MLLKDKVALITGATRGIGLETAKRFAIEGAHVIMSARSHDDLCARKAEIVQAVPEARIDVLALDVASDDSVKAAFKDLFSLTRRLDVLVANAGVLESAMLSMVTPGHVNRMFDVNTFGALRCAQYASRMMARNKAGSIIHLTSIIGTSGSPGYSVYAASKGAIVGLTLSLAKELAGQNIRVNAIAPGFIDTDMTRGLSDDKAQQTLAGIRMGRAGRAEEVATVALFLASDLSSYVTGQVIGVDGGMQP